MTTKITRINEIAKDKPQTIFTSIYHFINKELLMECFDELDGNKAVGIDMVTKEHYQINLDVNLENLTNKLKNKSYKPMPARKINIPKSNGKLRGLAIANFEDKIVQLALKKIIEAIFEPKLSDRMYGFRPNRSCHDALRQISVDIEWNNTNYVVEADIRGYFDNINHEKLIECLQLYIKDPNVIRLVKRFLKAGIIIENGKYMENTSGTPQGSILSPVLANIYMHYILVKWFETEVKNKCHGFASIINYADDFICCFQYKNEAEAFYKVWLPNRLKLGNLQLADDKTRLLTFGRYAKKENLVYKPQTFDFLGFTHYCSKSKKGNFRVKRKTCKKKFKTKLQEFNVWIKANRHMSLKELMASVKRKLVGHYNYFGITDNFHMIRKYYWEILGLTYKYLNRRSQRKSMNWEEFQFICKLSDIPKPKVQVSIYAN